MIIETGLATKQIEALFFRSQEALISQNEFFSTLNSGGASVLMRKYLNKGVLYLSKPDQHETVFERMKQQEYHTNTSMFFTFTQGSLPVSDIENWKLSVEGDGVEAPFSISYNDLLKLPLTTLTRYLECAHNGSAFYELLMNRRSEGPQWHFGGYGIAEWTGVRLADLLKKAKLTAKAANVLLIGLDGPQYSRPIPVAKAMEDDTLLAYIMNGQILPVDHGFPIRAVVPGWVGTASVKWVTRIIVSKKPISVINNTDNYVLIGPAYKSLPPAKGPVITNQLVKSACCLPWPATLAAGHQHIIGYAWSPFGKISQVDISIDAGKTFRPALLTGLNIERAGTRWEYHFDAVPGETAIISKATDEKGNTQYDLSKQQWNQLGYLFGAVVAHPLTITSQCCDAEHNHGDYSLMLPGISGCC